MSENDEAGSDGSEDREDERPSTDDEPTSRGERMATLPDEVIPDSAAPAPSKKDEEADDPDEDEDEDETDDADAGAEDDEDVADEGGDGDRDSVAPKASKKAPASKTRSDPGRREIRPSETPAVGIRESLLAGMTQRRTTLYEVGEVARRLSVLAPGATDSRREVRLVVLSFVVGLTVALLGTMAFAGGTLRLVLGILGGTGVAALATFGALRGLAALAQRNGAREIPGPALLWVGGAVLGALGVTIAFTFGLSEATEPLSKRLAGAVVVPTPSAAPKKVVRADADMERGKHLKVRRGVLYVPPDFESEDGQFDLLIHYHGNVQMVEESVALAKLNALVLIYNYGEGSGKYSKPLMSPRAFDNVLDGTEKRATELGLRNPRIRRIALMSWSAGYGALYRILESRSRTDRVDAVLMMDSLHGSFRGAAKGKVSDISLRPFVRFAERARAGEKLMVLTHTAIETQDYPDTTTSANALLEQVGVERKSVDPETASPAPVEIPVVLHAFPAGRTWMRVIDEAHEGGFHVYGCEGKAEGDHIAHLAQISETVLPSLVKRWNGVDDGVTDAGAPGPVEADAGEPADGGGESGSPE